MTDSAPFDNGSLIQANRLVRAFLVEDWDEATRILVEAQKGNAIGVWLITQHLAAWYADTIKQGRTLDAALAYIDSELMHLLDEGD